MNKEEKESSYIDIDMKRNVFYVHRSSFSSTTIFLQVPECEGTKEEIL